MFEPFAEWLISQGALGVIVAGMAYWIWRLQGRIDEVQDKRVSDAFQIVEAAHTISNSLDRNTEVLRAALQEE